MEWVAVHFSRGSFPPRNRTLVSCVAGILYTWATRESLLAGGSVSAEDPWVRRNGNLLKEEMATFPWRRKWYTFPAVDRRPWLATVQGVRVGRNLAQAHTPECLQPPPPPSCSHLCEPAVLKQLPLFTLGARFPHQGNHRMDPWDRGALRNHLVLIQPSHLMKEETKPREGKWCAQGHPARQWQSANSHSWASEEPRLTATSCGCREASCHKM